MQPNALKTTPYNSADYLRDEEDITAYLAAAREYDDPALIECAETVVANARRAIQRKAQY
jgi:DNA-binding phage protein